MTCHRRTRMPRAVLLGLAASLAALPALADPYDYRDRSDTITSSAGNAHAANIAVHTVNPWPRYAKKWRMTLDGKRAGLAITRYQANQSIPPKGLENAAPDVSSGQGASVTK